MTRPWNWQTNAGVSNRSVPTARVKSPRRYSAAPRSDIRWLCSELLRARRLGCAVMVDDQLAITIRRIQEWAEES
jgi:hypothetical protein